MKALKLLCLLIFLAGSTAFAQNVSPSSETVLNNAYAQAAKENKKVILIFHASWCIWCHKMEASINDPACKKMFDDNYVIAYLDVMETKEKENLENPGWKDVMNKFGNEKFGLPFWLVLDKKGDVLANSLMPKAGGASDNVGCPASEKEVAYFDGILKKTSKLKDEEIAIIHKRFLLNQEAAHPAPTNKAD
jgi:thiol-disulfide isomerase/thioredoxin